MCTVNWFMREEAITYLLPMGQVGGMKALLPLSWTLSWALGLLNSMVQEWCFLKPLLKHSLNSKGLEDWYKHGKGLHCCCPLLYRYPLTILVSLLFSRRWTLFPNVFSDCAKNVMFTFSRGECYNKQLFAFARNQCWQISGNVINKC